MSERNELTQEQIALYRSMTGEERLKMAEKMYWDARRAKEAELQVQHPDWSEEKVKAEVKRIFLEAAMKEE